MAVAPAAHELERRKRVRLRLRSDLSITPQRYEGRTYYVVKDPVTLRYYRFKEQEHFLLGFMDGKRTLDEAQQAYEKRFRPERLTLEDLEGFAQQLLTAGLAQNESPRAGQQLIDRRKKRQRSQLMQTLTNVLYIRIPLFDPDVLLKKMLPYFGFFFTLWFFAIASCVMFAAIMLVATHFETFRSKLPAYHEFFSFKTVGYLWLALGVVKVIHEFGHGLSCRKFGGEVHEMGLLFLVFSPAMYCNVSDSWTLPNKWHRIVISAAGIYVELCIAAVATFVWWNTPNHPFINYMSLCLMIICSVSTIVFNANPLMRYDGYYVLADWIEIPNLRERANRYLKNLFCEHCLGMEVPLETYMALWRRWLFVIFAIVSYVYRWVVTYFILFFLYNFLRPYKLGVVSGMLAMAALGSMIGWPIWNAIKNYNRRGRMPDMKPFRVTLTCCAFGLVFLAFFTIKVPISRIHAEGLVEIQPDHVHVVYVELAFDEQDQAILEELKVRDGAMVNKGDELARFSSRKLQRELALAEKVVAIQKARLEELAKFDDESKSAGDQSPFKDEIINGRKSLKQARLDVERLEDRQKNECIVRARRSGMVIGLPQADALKRQWNGKQPLCRIGDPKELRVVVPVEPKEFSLLQENLEAEEGTLRLPATVRVSGQGRAVWHGEVTRLPPKEAESIPIALSNRAGGPVPVRPSANPDELVPQTQQYLVSVDLDQDQNIPIRPGLRAKVKIHCRKRTMAWWVWRSICDTFNL